MTIHDELLVEAWWDQICLESILLCAESFYQLDRDRQASQYDDRWRRGSDEQGRPLLRYDGDYGSVTYVRGSE